MKKLIFTMLSAAFLSACAQSPTSPVTQTSPQCAWGSPSQAELNALLASLPSDALRDGCTQHYQTKMKGLYVTRSGDYRPLSPAARGQLRRLSDMPPKVLEEKLSRHEIQPVKLQLPD